VNNASIAPNEAMRAGAMMLVERIGDHWHVILHEVNCGAMRTVQAH